jgi:hypothetical protein
LPCRDGALVPNAILDISGFPPYLIFPPGTIKDASIELSYADGTTDTIRYAREQILQP